MKRAPRERVLADSPPDGAAAPRAGARAAGDTGRGVTGSPPSRPSRKRQLVPDMNVSEAFPGEGGARTGTEHPPADLGEEAPGGACGLELPVRALAPPRRWLPVRAAGLGGSATGGGARRRCALAQLGDLDFRLRVRLHLCSFSI